MFVWQNRACRSGIVARVLVTGGAGFIGSHLVDRLIGENEVRVYDNFSTGRMDFISQHLENKNFSLVRGDLLDFDSLVKEAKGFDMVIHAAANPEVRISDSEIHLKQNILATYNVLEAMRLNQVSGIVFTSTSTVYGEAKVIPTPEEYGPLIPISLYGASKLACEALIMAYSHTFDMRSWIFRFANIVGSRSGHGIIHDFIRKLRTNPKSLEILGDGYQSKSYLHVDDCVEAMLHAVKHSSETVNIFNIGSEDTITSNEIARIVVEEMGLKNVAFTYTGGERGWRGDVTKMRLSIEKLKEIGWAPRYNSERSIREAARSLLREP